VYSGNLNIGGYNYNIAAGSFSSNSGFYNLNQEHTAQSLSLKSNMRREWGLGGGRQQHALRLDTFRAPERRCRGGRWGCWNDTVYGWNRMVHVGSQGFWRPQDCRVRTR